MEPKRRRGVIGWSLLGALVVVEAILFYLWSSSSADDDTQLLLNIVVWAVGIIATILFLTLLDSGRRSQKKG